ncbi:hypothetical protein [Noviherbaspirillum sp. Root189]|uniref:hypothetical protein n=1 Tax=Noviherbaspirillum sp. Root189 TaxID=1736487 RepID=UPI00070E86CB|nr:hypothetical protein [Noviherbaspirillum sp. Root189]KRB66274.1 hypothetical protein ASE07_10345 [Noviherbaspirillum sp. Root189]
MWHIIAGRCGTCGAKKEWNEKECHGCHTPRNRYGRVLFGFVLTLSVLGVLGAVVIGLEM